MGFTTFKAVVHGPLKGPENFRDLESEPYFEVFWYKIWLNKLSWSKFIGGVRLLRPCLHRRTRLGGGGGGGLQSPVEFFK